MNALRAPALFRFGLALAGLGCLSAIACSKPQEGSAESRGAGQASATSTIAASPSAATPTAGPGAASVPNAGSGAASTPAPPELPRAVLAPILANTAVPFPVSPACNGYVFGDVNAEDTIRARVHSGWAARCKKILEDARTALANEYPAFASASVEALEDDPKSKEPRLEGAVLLTLSNATGRTGKGSAIYSVEWTHPLKGLGPFCPYVPEAKVPSKPGAKKPAQEVFAVSLKRLYRVGYATLMLGDFPAEHIQAIGLKLEAALDRCASVARRGS